MLDDRETDVNSGARMNPAFPEDHSHAYPRDLAAAVHGRCHELLLGTGIQLTLPDRRQLEQVLSVCFQASLLREEGRPVTVERGTDPARVKVVGNVSGAPPLRGVLRHRGWEATRLDLPPLPATGRTIIAPAEVEVA